MATVVIYSFNQIIEAMMEYNGTFKESFPAAWSNPRGFGYVNRPE